MSTGTKVSLALAAQRVVALVDRAGKTLVRLPPHVPHAAVIPDGGPRKIRSMDVHVPPGTVEVDLSALPPGSSIRVIGGADLSQLLLPSGSSAGDPVKVVGALVELHLDRVPGLHVAGAVSALSISWPVPGATAGARHRLHTRGPVRRPWETVWVGSLPPPVLVDAVVLFGLPGCRTLDLSHLHFLRTLELHRSRVESLTVGSAEQLVVHDCGALREVTATHLRRASFRGTHQLARICGSGESLSLFRCEGSGDLRVHGAWSRLDLCSCSWATLTAPDTTRIRLRNESVLERVTGAPGHHLSVDGLAIPALPTVGPVVVHGTVLKSVFQHVCDGTPVHERILERWVDGGTGRYGARNRLHGLYTGLVSGSIPPSVAWRLRTKLAHPERDKQPIGTPLTWSWSFHPDRAAPGWSADFHIWWICRETVPGARDFDAAVRRVRSAEALAVLADALVCHPELAEFLVAALSAPIPGPEQWTSGSSPFPDHDTKVEPVFRRLLRSVLRAGPRVDVQGLAAALAHHLHRRIQYTQPLVCLLASLHQLGAPAATNALAELATDGRLTPKVQRAALVALIAAPNPDARPLLAPETGPVPGGKAEKNPTSTVAGVR